MEPENHYFEHEMTPHELQVSNMLTEALANNPREGLTDRVAKISFASIQAGSTQNLEHQLDVAFAADNIESLNARIFEASTTSLHTPNSSGQSPVLAHINFKVLIRQVALAASLAFAAVVAIQFGSTPRPSFETASVGENIASLIDVNSQARVLSTEEEELLLQDLNLNEFTYLSDTREMAFADIEVDLDSLRDDIELWQYGLLTE